MSESITDLEKDIEASRARLDQTIDRIQGRLNASSLVDEMLGSARSTPYSSLYDGALEAVRRNPVPVLLIAAGVSLLLKSMAAGGGRTVTHPATPNPAPLPPDRAPVVTGADRTYDPDQPAGRPARPVLEDTQA